MKQLRIFGIFFGVQGILMLAGGVWLFYEAAVYRSAAQRTQGTVIANHLENEDSGSFYHPEIQFSTPDGQVHKFISKSGATSAAFKVGDRIPLLYDSDEPDAASIDTVRDSYLGATILTSIGAVMLIAGGIPVYLPIRRKRISEGLKNTGQRVEAQIGGATWKSSPFRISAQWTDPSTNKVYEFQSDEVGFDASPYLSQTIGVLIDPKNPKHYWMDTTFLPKAQ